MANRRKTGLKGSYGSDIPSDTEFVLLGLMLQGHHEKYMGVRLTPSIVSRSLAKNLGFGKMTDGSLYTIFSRMKDRGWITKGYGRVQVTEVGSAAFEQGCKFRAKMSQFGEKCLEEFLAGQRKWIYGARR